MGDIKDYKCLSCGAPLVFDANTQNLHCGSCGTEFSLETLQQIDETDENIRQQQSKYDWSKYEPRNFTAEDAVDLSAYSCPSCGAEIVGDNTMGSCVCPYCGNSTIIPGQFQNTLMPDYLIPFKIDKKKAMESFEQACKKARFLPDEFKNKKKIEEMTGVYVPFWMFDCKCNANIAYRANQVHTWSDSQYNYVRTDYYKLLRSGSIDFANVPVDGSIKADDAYMEAIEPFDYNDAVNFDTAYLSGFLADKYDVSAEDSIERANNRIKNSTESAFTKTTSRYVSVVPENTNINFSDGKIRYSLLPVWMLNLKYKDKMYKYAINGQTGKVVGEYPISGKKKWLYFTKVFAIALAVSAAALYVYSII